MPFPSLICKGETNLQKEYFDAILTGSIIIIIFRIYNCLLETFRVN